MGGSAWRLLTRAQKLAEQQKFDEALALAQQALREAPDQPGIRLQTALIHLDRGEPAEARVLLERDAPADNPAWPVFRALACLDLGDLVAAPEHLREAIKLASDNRVAWGLKATLLLRTGRSAEALKILDKAGIEASPRLLGRLLLEIERALNALGAGRIFPTPPTVAAASSNGGPIGAPEGTDAGDPATLSPAPDAQAAVDPPLPWDSAPYRNGTLDMAVGVLLDPMVAQRHLGRAEKLLMAQQPQPALEEARQAVRRFKDVPRGFCILGLAYLHCGHAPEALRCLEEAARRDGETPDVLYAQGCCYHEMGQLDRARERLEKMLEGFEKDAAARYTLGQIALEQNDEIEARRHFEAAGFLDFLLVKDRVQRLRKALQESAPISP